MSRREQNRPQHGQGPGGPRQGGRQNPEPRQNEALAEFKRAIQTKNFTDDDVMKLSDQLGKSLTYNPLVRGEREGKENTKNQVRKFYNLVRAAKGASQDMVKVKLRMLQAQVAYAVARKTISPDFKEFFDISLNKVIGSEEPLKSLGQFATFLEALYAYFYFYTEARR